MLKMLEFRAVSSIIWINRDLEILEMAEIHQGQADCDTVRPASKCPWAEFLMIRQTLENFIAVGTR